MQVAADLIYVHGIQGTNNEMVRQSAGISGSQLSHYFPRQGEPRPSGHRPRRHPRRRRSFGSLASEIMRTDRTYPGSRRCLGSVGSVERPLHNIYAKLDLHGKSAPDGGGRAAAHRS